MWSLDCCGWGTAVVGGNVKRADPVIGLVNQVGQWVNWLDWLTIESDLTSMTW